MTTLLMFLAGLAALVIGLVLVMASFLRERNTDPGAGTPAPSATDALSLSLIDNAQAIRRLPGIRARNVNRPISSFSWVESDSTSMRSAVMTTTVS